MNAQLCTVNEFSSINPLSSVKQHKAFMSDGALTLVIR